MFIGSYKGCMESPKYNKCNNNKVVTYSNKVTTYSVYKMDMRTTKASPIGKKYTNWEDAMDVSTNIQRNNTDKNVYYFPDEN